MSFTKMLSSLNYEEFKETSKLNVKRKDVEYKNGEKFVYPLLNFDEKRKESYELMKKLLGELFEEVNETCKEVPPIWKVEDKRYYSRSKYVKDSVIQAKKLKKFFSNNYELDESFKVEIVYRGEGNFLIRCCGEKTPSKELIKIRSDIEKIYNSIVSKNVKDEKIGEIVKNYFPKTFTTQNITENVPYEEIIKKIKEFNPPVNKWNRRRIKITYEKICSNKIPPEEKEKIDRICYEFIVKMEKINDEEKECELCCEFERKVKELANQSSYLSKIIF